MTDAVFFNLQAGSIIIVFLVFLVLMYLRKVPALFALPLMAVGFTAIGGLGYFRVEDTTFFQALSLIFSDIGTVASKGAVRLHSAYTVAIFGGMLAIFVKEKKIAESIIKFTAELGGDNPYWISLMMFIVSALIFSTIGGLGAVIMVGTIILPILVSMGVAPTVAGGIYLLGLCAGGSMNPGAWSLYMNTLEVSKDVILFYALSMTGLYGLVGVLFISTQLKVKWKYPIMTIIPLLGIFAGILWSISGNGNVAQDGSSASFPILPILAGTIYVLGIVVGGLNRKNKGWAMLTPLQPILLSISGCPFILAFILGLLYGFVTAYEKGDFRILSKSIIQGAESVMPAVILMFGIGMLLIATNIPVVSAPIKPLFNKVALIGPWSYVIVFTLLSPLALYRGPLSLWGMGAGLASIFLATKAFPNPALIMGIFISVGAVQGVCDPTNTHNVWIANYLGKDVLEFTRKMFPFVVFLTFLGLSLASILYYN